MTRIFSDTRYYFIFIKTGARLATVSRAASTAAVYIVCYYIIRIIGAGR